MSTTTSYMDNSIDRYNDDTITLTKREDLGKPKGLDIEKIIKRVDQMDMTDKDKADLLKALKYSLINPELGENQDLDRIEQKYLIPKTPEYIQPTQPMVNPLSYSYMPKLPDYTYQIMKPVPQLFQQPHKTEQNTQYMTTTHFEILKSKIDSLQYELIDLLRHVKDYTQRYMNAVRQSDLQRIDEYINGLFEVEKNLAEAKKQASILSSTPTPMPDTGMLGKIAGLNSTEGTTPNIPPLPTSLPEKEPETEEGFISKTTNGIKNFISGIGSNLSGITGLVKSTADIANNVLSKKIIGSDEPTTSPQPTITTPSKPKLGKNELTIDEYISNMNEINKSALIPELPNSRTTISSNLNKMNTTSTQPIKPKITTQSNNMNVDLPSAVQKLDKVITNNTSRPVVTTNTNIKNNKTIVTSQNMSGGSKKITKLSNKIKLLKLKITQRNLEQELKKKKSKKNEK